MDTSPLTSRSLPDLGDVSAHGLLSGLVKGENLPLLAGGVVFLFFLRFVCMAVYRVYFHPLSKYPGPKYAIISTLTYHIINSQGISVEWTRKQHEQYGEVVRLGPDRLSYISPQAWKDIYGHRSGGKLENPKDSRFYMLNPNGSEDIITVRTAQDHGRQRKIFTNAFSDKALKLQEPMVRKYVDQLIDNIRRDTKADPATHLDMVKLYNCTTFDIMGDLTFGEPLGMLDHSEYTPWVKAVFASVKYTALAQVTLEYPLFGQLLERLMPRSLLEQKDMHFQHSNDRVDRRLARGNDAKPDIWKLVLDNSKSQLTLGQMHANSSIFMVAGTETTATLLSGLTYHLLTNPEKLNKVVAEIRALSSDDLTLETLPRLPYMNACFEEGLRFYPPVPFGVPREIAPGGNVICGEWVPEKTRVYVHQHSAYRSPLNFKNPNQFVPERWLPGHGYDDDRKDALQPFSTGPRNCLGKNLAYHEMRIILAKVLWNFDLELCEESARWADQKTFTLWQKPELWCRATPVRR